MRKIAAAALLLSAAASVAWANEKPRAVRDKGDLGAECLLLGLVSSDDPHPMAQGGSQLVTYRLSEYAAKLGGDAFIPKIVGGGQAVSTVGSAEVYRCSRTAWIGGSIPPLYLPSLAYAEPIRPSGRGSCGAGSIKKAGPFELGSSYASVRPLLGMPVKMLPQGAALDLNQITPGSALLFPTDDARGRRWLLAKGFQSPDGWLKEKTVLALGFNGKQELETIAWFFYDPPDSRIFKDFRARTLAALDAQYGRLDIANALGLTAWAGSEPGSAILAFAAEGGFLAVYTKDPVELAVGADAYGRRCR